MIDGHKQLSRLDRQCKWHENNSKDLNVSVTKRRHLLPTHVNILHISMEPCVPSRSVSLANETHELLEAVRGSAGSRQPGSNLGCA